MKRSHLALLLVIAASDYGCGDKTEAHFGRFLDTKSTVQAEEVKPFDAFAMPDDPKMADAIHTASFSQVARLLGAHRFQGQIHFRFEGPKHRVSLREEDTIILARNGDFKVKVDNNKGQGYEIIYAANKLYMRNRYGPFHERSRISGDHLRWRDKAYGGWSAIYKLFRGRLRFIKLGMTNHHGRNAVRFSLGLSSGKPRLPGTLEPPEIPEGVTQYVYPIEPTQGYTDRWREKAKPWQVKGNLVLDANTGIILMAELTGQWQFTANLPQNELENSSPESAPAGSISWAQQTVTLHTWAKIQSDGFGNPSAISAPSEKLVKPIPERIEVETHPLDFYFGKGYTATLGKPAGVAGNSKKPASSNKSSTGGSASNQ